jgi:putative ABC transport system permease protein
MTPLREIGARVAGLLRRRRPGADLDREMQFHIEMMEQQLVGQGMDRDEAHREACARFGGATQVSEAYRDQQTIPWLETLMQDARYGVRMWMRSPGLTAVALLTLALGIGANAAIFSLVDRVLLRPLPYADGDRLFLVGDRDPVGTTSNIGTPYGTISNIGFATLKDYADRTRAFESLVAVRSWLPTLVADGTAEGVPALRVGWKFFSMLGARPALGRDFQAADDTPDRYRVLILSDGLWRRRFGGDPSVIGRKIQMGGQAFEIIGIMPRDFEPLISERFYQRAEMWAPLGYDVSQSFACRSCQHLKAVGKLRAGVSHAQALADLNAIRRQLAEAYPDDYPAGEMAAEPLADAIAGPVRPALLVLLGAVGFVLLIACANVANLLLARAVARTREMGVRAALGAGRGRLIRQVLTESTLLSLVGGALGVALAALLLRSLSTLAPVTLPRIERIGIDGWVLAFTAVVSIVTGLVFGLAPALRISAFRLAAEMSSDPRTTAGVSAGRAQRALVAADVAVALVLLTGAGLMIRTVGTLTRSDAGFNASHVFTAQFAVGGAAYREEAAVVQFQNLLLERVRVLPGVESAAVAGQVPMGGNFDRWGFHIEGRMNVNPSEDPSAERYSVTPDYFHVLQIPLVRGRLITSQDLAGTQPVMVISETAAKLWGGEEPIGGRVRIGGNDGPWRTIVGIVRDVHHQDLTAAPNPQMYLPQSQVTDAALVLVIRSSAGVESLSPAVRQIMRSLDAGVPIYRVAMLDTLVQASYADRQFVMRVLGAFALLALLLAAIGLYGVIACTVSERTREVGLRVALGATKPDILRLVFASGARAIAVGLVIGVVAAQLLPRVLESMLFGTEPSDPMSLGAAVAALAGVTAIAHWIPARRALHVDPATALRQS